VSFNLFLNQGTVLDIKEFYTAIKTNQDPENFKQIQELIEKEHNSNSKQLNYSTHFYLKTFLKYENKQGLFFSFNTAALIFPLYWLIYRRMYSLAIALFGIQFLADFIEPQFSYYLWILLTISIELPLRLLGNSLFFWNTKRRVEKGFNSKTNGWLLLVYLILESGYTLYINLNQIQNTLIHI
jgi:hypothetical protein